MLKSIILSVLFFLASLAVSAQDSSADNLKNKLSLATSDTSRMILMGSLAYHYSELNPDSTIHYAERMLALTKKLKLPLEEVFARGEMGYALINLGNYPRSLQTLLAGVAITDDPDSEKNILQPHYPSIDVYLDRSVSPRMQRMTKKARILQYLAILYGNSGNNRKAVDYYWSAIKTAEEANNFRILSISYTTLGRTYLTLGKKDSALWAVDKSLEYANKAGFQKYTGSILLNKGRVYLAQGNKQVALESFHKALLASREHGYYRGVAASNLALADMYKQNGKRDSVLYYTNNGLLMARYLNAPDLFLRSYRALADYYKSGSNNDSVVKYQSLIIKINDSLFNSKQAQDFQNIDFNEQQRQQQIETAKSEYRNKIQIYMLLAGLGIFLLIALILWRNSMQRRKTNIILSKQKAEIENALENLKSTQKQLVQSEKMASLGEMTAGIAHEIQNPLNFVNNFSEVNRELISEMLDEISKGNYNEAKTLAKDISDNEEKINFHGKRADGIVKSMLQHSRRSSGQKELTDINALCDEYLRLAYHGLRAKDKSFNAKFETALDPNAGKINVMPQDIGRVILNLINNSFYASAAKATAAADSSFIPAVWVSTKKAGDKIQISVKDNGPGIPGEILDKIFQPFFTTKPTGEGTGLGLSLSYDIITKGHGGEMKVETKEGEFTEFTIILPV